MKRAGTSLVLVLFILSGLTLAMTAALRSAILALDISLQRNRHETQLWATQGFLQYGIAHLHAHATELFEKKNSLTLPINASLLTENMRDHTGVVTLHFMHDEVDIGAQLKKDQTIIVSLRCECKVIFQDKERQNIERIDVSKWRIDEAA